MSVAEAPLKPPPPPTWSSIPHKGQLAIICSVRIADFFQQAALQAYMYYQLKSFDPTLSDADISFQAGVLLGVFTSAQIVTGILWGRVADSPAWGRKRVLMLSLVAQGLSCLGVAFSQSFVAAVIWRGLGGAANATVGGARTALSEATEKKYHTRTFLVLPLAWNVANIFGPMIGGGLSDPVLNYPALFGNHSVFGGEHGVGWMKAYPFAVPNMFCAMVCFADAALIFFGLRETLAARRMERDRGLEWAESLRYYVRRIFFKRFGYSQISQEEAQLGTPGVDDMEEASSTPLAPMPPKELGAREPEVTRMAIERPSFRATITRNVCCVLLTVAFMDFQMGGFTSLWTVFLSSSLRTKEESSEISLPFHFAGGIGMSPSTIGLAMSTLGFVGILFQLTLYPTVNARYGLLKSTIWSLWVFPLAYAIAPYLSLTVHQPFLLWLGVILVAALQVGARTFAVPGLVLLTNNASPSPAVLGTIHGMGAATSSAARTIGPIVAGHWYSQGLEKGSVGTAWWLLSLVAFVGVVPSYWARDGK
jgi:MFS family permease